MLRRGLLRCRCLTVPVRYGKNTAACAAVISEKNKEAGL